MLAPLLLMLSQDPLMLPDLEDKQRYFPPTFAISAYLVVSSLFDVSVRAALAESQGCPGHTFI